MSKSGPELGRDELVTVQVHMPHFDVQNNSHVSLAKHIVAVRMPASASVAKAKHAVWLRWRASLHAGIAGDTARSDSALHHSQEPNAAVHEDDCVDVVADVLELLDTLPDIQPGTFVLHCHPQIPSLALITVQMRAPSPEAKAPGDLHTSTYFVRASSAGNGVYVQGRQEHFPSLAALVAHFRANPVDTCDGSLVRLGLRVRPQMPHTEELFGSLLPRADAARQFLSSDGRKLLLDVEDAKMYWLGRQPRAGGQWSVLFNENACLGSFSTTHLVMHCIFRGVDSLTNVRHAHAVMAEFGFSPLLPQSWSLSDDNMTQRKFSLVHYALQQASQRDAESYAAACNTTAQDVHASLRAKMPRDDIRVCVYFDADRSMQRLVVRMIRASALPLALIRAAFPSAPEEFYFFDIPEDAKPEDYVLKTCDKDEYLLGPIPLQDFAYIRYCLLHDDPIMLQLVPRDQLDLELSEMVQEPFPTFGAIDVGLPQSKDHPDVGTFRMSVLSVETSVQVRVQGLVDLRDDLIVDGATAQILVSLLHGQQALSHVQGTGLFQADVDSPIEAPVVFSSTRLCDIPRATVLRIALVLHQPQERPTASSTSHFGMASNPRLDGDDILAAADLPLFDASHALVQGVVKVPLFRAHSVSKRSNLVATVVLSFPRFMGQIVHPQGYGPLVDSTSLLQADHEKSLDEEVAQETRDLLEFHRVTSEATESSLSSVLSQLEAGSDQEEHVAMARAKITSAHRELKDQRRLFELSRSDLLQPLSEDDCAMLFRRRRECCKYSELLPLFLRAVSWSESWRGREAYRILEKWTTPKDPAYLLQLLHHHHADLRVRQFAVERLDAVCDKEFELYLLQLVQVLRFELYADNPLARLLLRRALRSRRIGQALFWHLLAELSSPGLAGSCKLLLHAYMCACGNGMLRALLLQWKMATAFEHVATTVRNSKGSLQTRTSVAQKMLSKVSFPQPVYLPYDVTRQCTGIACESSFVLDSKKKPVWVSLKDSLPKPAQSMSVIFKGGDDLRQDMLTLQMLKIMDRVWENEGLFLYMTPYGCIATGNQGGLIEVVQKAQTLANIQRQSGGSLAAFKEEPLLDWLRAQCLQDKDALESARDRFVMSCAGYCVATYVLGLGDRHNDNIMLTSDGRLLHIDFGHFLGNVKFKFGLKRERAPFVLTPDMVYVMGKKDGARFKRFVSVCIKAYLALRRHANLLISLFAMMVATDIPELQSDEDISYLRRSLSLELSEEDAASSFKQLIYDCLRLSWSTQINFWVHNMKRN